MTLLGLNCSREGVANDQDITRFEAKPMARSPATIKGNCNNGNQPVHFSFFALQGTKFDKLSASESKEILKK